ncbi:MAG: hypothetical protein IJC17_04785 [Clostridia bacterium]|nr:hypothetical protein [Clostridia bacterium]
MFDIDSCYSCFATEPNSAYFWSGLGEKGEDIAANIAKENNGVTLETLMREHKDELINAGFEYDKELDRFLFSPDNYSDWEAISKAYAEQASGEVRAILGDNIRQDSVWNTKEQPALSNNNTVSKIISVDPKTGQEKDVLLDKSAIQESAYSQNAPLSISSTNIKSIGGGGSRAPDQLIAGKSPPQTVSQESGSTAETAGRLPQQTQTPVTATDTQQSGTTPDKKQNIDIPSKQSNFAVSNDLAQTADEKPIKGVDVASGVT